MGLPLVPIIAGTVGTALLGAGIEIAHDRLFLDKPITKTELKRELGRQFKTQAKRITKQMGSF